ncbi:MAG: hypothetical protein JRJ38_19820 [Deltaproteobacteria bacterium]|nr:hypothetical protein [Deltaproteobacteria bacterium]
MKYLDAVFWDYPEFTDPVTIRRHLEKRGNQRVRRWLLKRFLEHGPIITDQGVTPWLDPLFNPQNAIIGPQ